MKKPKIAFVGTGGAARGIAHIGVLRACEELGIVPDIFVGASAGAIIGATYGQGVALDELVDSFRLPWRRRHHGLHLGLPTFFGRPSLAQFLDPGHLLSGVFSIDKLEKHLRERLPVNDFRKVDRTIIVTAVDVDRAERVVFGRGHDDETPISEAVAASCCVPGLYRPYPIRGRYHLDGEVVRTLSADIAVEAGADIVIISNVYRPSRTLGRARSIGRRGITAVLAQSVNILLTEKEKRGVDWYARTSPQTTFIDVAPDIGRFGYLNSFAARSLIQRGYHSGLRTLVEAKERGAFDLLPAGRSQRLN